MSVASQIYAMVLEDVPELEGCRCSGLYPQWDTDVPGESAAERSQRIAWASAQCQECPALSPCRAWAASATHHKVTGVVAGTYHAAPKLFLRGDQ